MRRHFLITTLFLGLLLVSFFSSLAYANSQKVFVSKIVKFSETDCAIELTISEDGQDHFTDNDTIKIGNNTIVTMQAAVAAGINEPQSRHNKDDKILAVSNTFDKSNRINPDLTFDDSACSLLDSNPSIGFYPDGTSLAAGSALEMNSTGSLAHNTAIVKNGASEAPTLVNLSSSSISVANNMGDKASLSATTAKSSGAGCSLIR